jgi:hypothetical protein
MSEEDFTGEVEPSYDALYEGDDGVISSYDAEPNEADYLDMAAPTNGELEADWAYREWTREFDYRCAVERQKRQAIRSLWRGRQRHPRRTGRRRRLHRPSAGRAPTEDGGDSDHEADGLAPSSRLESSATRVSKCLLPAAERQGTGSGTVEAFARAIVRPGGNALLLRPDNSRDRWVSIREAVHSGRAFTVEVDQDILAIDADSEELGRAAEALAADLRAAGHHPVLLASGQPGRRHVFVRISDPDVLANFRSRATSQGLDVRTSIRPPLAPHRLGLEAKLLEPSDPQEALPALQTQRRVQPERRRSLKPDMAILLALGDRDGRYPSRSHMIQALATAAVNAGWSESEFSEALLGPSNEAGAKVRAMNLWDQKRYISRSWEVAKRFVMAHPAVRDRAAAQDAIRGIGEMIQSTKWPGRGGATELTILKAHIEIALETSKLTYHADVRTLADKAGVVASTASRVNWRLVDAGWLKAPQTPQKKGEAHIWTLAAPNGVLRNTPISSPEVAGGLHGNTQDSRGGVRTSDAESPRPDANRNHDVFRWGGGLGKSTQRVFDGLDPKDPAQVDDLAESLRMSKPIVRRYLRRLEGHDLAEDTDTGWLRGPRSLDEVAAELGMAGRGSQQRLRHGDDRAKYRQEDERAKGQSRWMGL